MKICYKEKRFGKQNLQLIETADSIIHEYESQGYELTLRQLYYQFVARGFIANNMKSYQLIGAATNYGRMAGLLDWEMIVDRTRELEENSHWNSPSEIIETCAAQYRIDLRKGQETYIEVWVEKEALAGILEKVCTPLDVPWFCCRGYVSISSMWRAAIRIKEKMQEEHQNACIIYLGDHDPSGIDMTRDIKDRLNIFGLAEDVIDIRRIALNIDQIKKFKPPTNPAKITDSRAKNYIDKFGNDSWELDALEPKVIHNLIEIEIERLTDHALFDRQYKWMMKERKEIKKIAENYKERLQ